MSVFTYEYVTIHLITINAEMEEVLEPMLKLRRVGGPMSPIVGINRQLEQTPGFGRKRKSKKPELVGGKTDVSALSVCQYTKVNVT